MRRIVGQSWIVLQLFLTIPSFAAAGDAKPILVVGDSLAKGMEPTLGALAAPRRLVWDVDAGRTTPEGLVRLRAQLRTFTPSAVLISLGTNDGPHADRFRNRIRRVLRAVPPGVCVVWADLDRPARKGPYKPLNAQLERAARHDHRLVIVHWHRAVATRRVSLPDRIHPDAAGFAERSRMYADALAHGCGKLGP